MTIKCANRRCNLYDPLELHNCQTWWTKVHAPCGFIEQKTAHAQPRILHDIFQFTYVGGGYFRKRGVPKGESAEVLHGMQAIEYLYKLLNNKEHS